LRILLDTCTFLWVISGDAALSERARRLVTDRGNECFLSSVSAWEIAVKNVIGKLPLPDLPDRFVPAERERHGIAPLPLDEFSALQLPRLPLLHRDPFDRMLVCQALAGGLTILTPDEQIRSYPVLTDW
jgi:PIN domain nuclease of toxin-antitoxin system